MEKTTNAVASRTKTQFAPGIDLTPMQRQFVTELVRKGGTPTQAARSAGYQAPAVASYDLLHLPHVQAAIRHERERYISGELANVATGTLHAILVDQAAPASARVQAARTVLEMSGEIGRHRQTADQDRPLSELSADELAGLIDKWTAERAALARPLEPGEVEIVDSAQDSAQLTALGRMNPGESTT